jgi:CRP/FNR family transcriptional regulator, cyclic AMP receptor protein
MAAPMHDTTLIRRIPLLRDLADDEAATIASTVTDRRFARHQFIVREGDAGDAFYILIKGSVSVCRLTSDGHETILSILKEGDFFGEMAVLDSSLRSASIKTLTECEVGAIHHDDFLEMLNHNPRIGRFLTLALSHRLRAANDLIAAMTSMDVRARLATLLFKLVDQFGEGVENGTRITLRLTNQEMANMIGASRDTVNRALNRLWDERIIDMRTAYIVITDSDRLRALIP